MGFSGCDWVNLFQDWPVTTLKAICLSESSGDVAAHVYSDVTKDDSYGLMQINLYGNLKLTRPPAEKLTDAEFNIRYAHDMWLGQGLTPWSTYVSGAYLKNIGR